MAPEYEAAGKELKESGLDSKVVLAELDGSANDSTIDSMEWQGFPTLFFIKKGTKTPMPYDGPRDKVGILEWIKKNSDQDLAVDTEAILEKDAAPTEEL
jgi:protein disulfide-isomerase